MCMYGIIVISDVVIICLYKWFCFCDGGVYIGDFMMNLNF